MAHYMAMHGSRFSFSHDTCHFPIYGIDGILQEKDTVMNFRRGVDGKQIPFHRAMHFLFRPRAMENMCSYEFFQKMEFVSRTAAKREGGESFDFPEDHPCQESMVVVYRKRECVPVFPWHWLGSTAAFASTMCEESQDQEKDYAAKEEYAYKFMLLFLPFRIDADLRHKESYLRRWQLAYECGEFQAEMIIVADNIHTIYNSLSSTLPESGKLALETILDEENGAKKNIESQERNEVTDLWENIGDYFASTSGTDTMTEDAILINRTFAGKFLKGPACTAIAENDLNSVIQYEDMVNVVEKQKQKNIDQRRFTMPLAELNSLCMTQRLLGGNQEEGNQYDGNEVTQNSNVNANGTCESIVLWGRKAGLDPEQQCAFEILAATYVLTFYEDATFDIGEDKSDFTQRKEKLQLYARRKPDSAPLIMFITGPAGAGKCK